MGLVEQIRSAQALLGWSNQQLLERSDLTFDVSGLSRRFAGDIRISDKEVESLAAAIRVGNPKFRLLWPNRLAAV